MSDADSVVKTYMPEAQKDEWRDHADELDMSLSEFVRTMVQAGRRGFLDDVGSTAKNDGLDERVLAALSEEPRSWDELRDHLVTSVEDDLEATLTRLQDDSRVRYSGRDGGYTIVDDA
ncbi:DUF5805 domain-containing protein [Halococcoides cellulosivorans]|uniref:Uncharacterized protein n=1 Tax=Halococcoides cellulosivorans TaxID=1679096 RepID=A0A2R4X0L9_9EURY|nr:DUF5805 domain-containing protein [Halococcoides cellulosivorans]AWB27311.1 hypothetical protein HARCEL1_06145 [Halococcoides cellulosivorans]